MTRAPSRHAVIWLAGPGTLGLYPVLLLVGDHDFNRSDDRGTNGSTLAERLVAAATAPGSLVREVVLQRFHVNAMGGVAWAVLRATGKMTSTSF